MVDILTEIQEDVRQERLVALAKKVVPVGLLIVAAVIITIIASNWWTAHRAEKILNNSAAYEAALKGDIDNALVGMRDDISGPYNTLAGLRLAAEGKADYEAIASDARDPLKSYANLQALFMQAESGEIDAALKPLEALTKQSAAFRYQAMLLLAVYHPEKDEQARYISELLLDPATPAAIKEQANMWQQAKGSE